MPFQVHAVLGVVALASVIRGAKFSAEQSLINDLLKGYNKDAHPEPQQINKTAYKVIFGLELVQLVNVDDKNQIITTNVWVRQRWRNLLLSWDPAKHYGIKKVRVDPKLLWIPDVVLYNSADSEFSGGLEKYKTRVILDNNGDSAWYSPASFRSTCNIDVTFFPFDEQTCYMKFGSWTFEIRDLDIYSDNSPLYSSQYVKSAEWDLTAASKKRNVESYACCAYPFSDVNIQFSFRRKPLFYIFNLILPCLIIMCMVLLGFFLPPESGERITLNITVLLAMAVFLQLAAENLPRNSENVPILGVFYITVMVEVATSLVATCFVLHIHHQNSGTSVVPVPHWINVYILGNLGKFLGVKPPIDDDHYDATSKTDFKRLSVMKKDFERRLCRKQVLAHSSASTRLLNGGVANSGQPPNSIVVGQYDMDTFGNSNGAQISNGPQCTCQEDERHLKNSLLTDMNLEATQGIMVLADHVKHRRLIEKNQDKWKHLAMVLDRLFFWIFIFVIVTSTVVILKAPSSK